MGWVSGTSGSTLTILSLEDVRSRGSVKSCTARLRVSTERKHRESGIEVNYGEQPGYAVVTDNGAGQKLFALLHLPAFETIQLSCGSREFRE